MKHTYVPEGAEVEYRPNNKYTEVGIYEVEATISMKGYETKTLTATLEIKTNEFENLVFENVVFNYDGLEKEIIVKLQAVAHLIMCYSFFFL